MKNLIILFGLVLITASLACKPGEPTIPENNMEINDSTIDTTRDQIKIRIGSKTLVLFL